MGDWHHLERTDLGELLQTDLTHGLTTAEAERRRVGYGANVLQDRGHKAAWRILLEQLKATMVLVLLAAAGVALLLGDASDAIAILAIVALNALLGFTQEYRAERAMAALQRLAVPSVTAVRDGQSHSLSARELVPGDLVLLEAGGAVPADGRVIESASLRIQEAALTGESEPVDKRAERLDEPTLPIGDRSNMAYMGTLVTYGRGRLIVTETGMATELGHIATMLQAVGQEPTPLQRRLDRLGRQLALVALVIVGLIFVVGLMRGEEITLMFLTAVSLAVAAVPEGLPAVVTIALALGAQRMLRRRALIRRLAAVETLGAVTVICSDKTGTLTENRMTVTILDAAGQRYDLQEHRHGATPVLEASTSAGGLPADHPSVALLLLGAALCNDARLEPTPGEPTTLEAIGDPTEGALVVAAAQAGLLKGALEAWLPRVAEVPFDSERRRMTTVHRWSPAGPSADSALAAVSQAVDQLGAAPHLAITKGAPDALIEVASHVWSEQAVEPMTAAWRARLTRRHEAMARDGLRVLAVAVRPLPTLDDAGAAAERLERGLTLVGLVGLLDPVRPEAVTAVHSSAAAGIRPVMITGDHPLTARAIARALGLDGDDRLLTGAALDQLTDAELAQRVGSVSVYARVSPQHKLRIVSALQRQGAVVAMTGDGVNDAPALRRADIGVAMGITGTDVAKEAADMVLLDDNFATIVAAIEEGRVIYDNIRKFFKYLMTTNSAEIWVMTLAPALGMPLPLLPLQILWVNLVTDGLPALALSVEPAEAEVMRRRPVTPGESIFAHGLGWHVVWVGLLMALVTLGVGLWYWLSATPTWQTMVFTTLTGVQLAHVLAIHCGQTSALQPGRPPNWALLGAVGLTIALQLAVVYLPPLQHLFQTTPLSASDLVLCLALSTIVFGAVEAEKWWSRRRSPARSVTGMPQAG